MASRGKGAKNKGSSYERKIAKLLSNWFYGDDDSLVRAPRSGGGSWKGDIVKNPEKENILFNFCIECKNEEGWKLEQLFNQDCEKSMIMKFWYQTIKQCPEDKIPLLIFTRNFQPNFLMCNTKYGLHHFVRRNSPVFFCKGGTVIQLLSNWVEPFIGSKGDSSTQPNSTILSALQKGQ